MEKRTARLKAQYAYNSRNDRGCSPEVLAGLKRDYLAARLAETIRSVLTESGPFTSEQVQELSALVSTSKAAG